MMQLFTDFTGEDLVSKPPCKGTKGQQEARRECDRKQDGRHSYSSNYVAGPSHERQSGARARTILDECSRIHSQYGRCNCHVSTARPRPWPDHGSPQRPKFHGNNVSCGHLATVSVTDSPTSSNSTRPDPAAFANSQHSIE